jgi:4-hydroxybenzoate polyprenyltransferase
MILGAVIALKQASLSFSSYLFFSLLMSLISLWFVALFAMITNNISDKEIDQITNPTRVLVSRKLKPHLYSMLQYLLLGIGLLLALFVSFRVFFFLTLAAGNYYLYSMPPIRFKRLLYLSKSTICINSLAICLAGYCIVSGSLVGFPNVLILFFLLVFIHPVQFIDLKDYKGDRHNNILTLPVFLGLKRSKLFIGLSFILANMSVYFFVKNLIVVGALVVIGVIQFILINKKNYNEKPVFWIYLSSMLGLIILIGLEVVAIS